MDTPTLLPGLDALAQWREAMRQQWDDLAGLLAEHGLLTESAQPTAQGVAQRLQHDRLVVAFVAEFSRGKSELINALLFADTGRRVLPASPGRTTMCPVELGWDPTQPPSLDLLPIHTRRGDDELGTSLAAWRAHPERWHRVSLDPADPAALAQALSEVTRHRRVPPAMAQALGLWSADAPQDNPPTGPDGLVEVPAWRHALVNYPHPLLARGLVVLDTPGLNAVGTEPELTLGLLPAAHAALFVLGADTGVTRSDLAIWRDHLGDQKLSCYVALNKIDTLADPLTPPAEVEAAMQRQCASAAAMLGLSPDRVFPVSARRALTARMAGDVPGLAASGLPALEQALGADLLPRRQQMLGEAVIVGARTLVAQAVLRVRELRRGHAEQMLELRSLRGKSNSKVRLMLRRVEQETQDFERCTVHLAAMRSVHLRQMQEALQRLNGPVVAEAIQRLSHAVHQAAWPLKAQRAFADTCDGLRGVIEDVIARTDETAAMLQGSFRQLNTDYAFTLSLDPPPGLPALAQEIDQLHAGYRRYLGLQNALRLRSPAFSLNLVHMLASRLSAVFEQASEVLQQWHQSVSVQVDTQLREKRRHFRRRHESLARIQDATDGLDARLAEVEQQDALLHALLSRANQRADALCTLAGAGPSALPRPPGLHAAGRA
jgi:hypothetical protein